MLRKSCICDLDDATVGDRAEWTHCVYDTMYHPLCAFTLELQWLVASGSRLAELVRVKNMIMDDTSSQSGFCIGVFVYLCARVLQNVLRPVD